MQLSHDSTSIYVWLFNKARIYMYLHFRKNYMTYKKYNKSDWVTGTNFFIEVAAKEY